MNIKKLYPKYRCLKGIVADQEVLSELIKSGTYRIIQTEIPKNARFVGIAEIKESRSLIFYYEHYSFPLIKEGEMIPTIRSSLIEILEEERKQKKIHLKNYNITERGGDKK
jgi:hypothetical protein